MEINNENFLLADDISDKDYESDSDTDTDSDDNPNTSSILESMYIYEKHDNETTKKEGIKNEEIENYYSYEQDINNHSPRLINISINKSWIDELNAFFKLNNLITCIKNDENKNSNKQKKDMSVSKIIMNTIIDKKLGSVTYHYDNKKSAKAYYTYDYPEIYYNKKLYNNISQWLKEEFSKKI